MNEVKDFVAKMIVRTVPENKKIDLAIIFEALAEIRRQDEEWGIQAHPDGTGGYEAEINAHSQKSVVDSMAMNGDITWKEILLEEVYEVFAETDPQKISEELNQVIAVAIQWRKAIANRAR